MGETPAANKIRSKFTYELPGLASGISFWIFYSKNNWGTPRMPADHKGRFTRKIDTFYPPNNLILGENEEFKLGVIFDTPNLGSFGLSGYTQDDAKDERETHDKSIAIVLKAGLTIEKEDLATWDTNNPNKKIIRTRFWLTDRKRHGTSNIGWTVNNVWGGKSNFAQNQVWF